MHDSDTGVKLKETQSLLEASRVRYTGEQSDKANKSDWGKAGARSGENWSKS